MQWRTSDNDNGTSPPARKEEDQQPLLAVSLSPLCIVIRSPLLIAGFTFIYLFGAKVGIGGGTRQPRSTGSRRGSSRQAGQGITITLAGNLAESNASSPPSPRRDSADYRWLHNGSQRGVCAYITRRPTRRSRGGFNGEIEVVGLLLSRFVCFARSFVLGGVPSGGFFLFFFFSLFMYIGLFQASNEAKINDG